MTKTEGSVNNDRRAVLVSLLDHWRDFFDEPTPNGQSAAESARSSDDWSLFSTMGRQQPALELRRCVELLERMGSRGKKLPVHHCHLMAYTAYAEWRLVDKPIKRRAANGKWVDDVERVSERIVPAWIDRRIVEFALDVVLGMWDVDVALEMPRATRRRLVEVTTEQGTFLTTEAA